jgi:hypothetical protein
MMFSRKTAYAFLKGFPMHHETFTQSGPVELFVGSVKWPRQHATDSSPCYIFLVHEIDCTPMNVFTKRDI